MSKLAYLKRSVSHLAMTVAVAASVAACSQNSVPPTVTIADVQNEIKAACNYVPTIQSIVSVATTISSAINPAAGATATVLVATGNAVVTQICQAVQTQTMAKAKGPGAAKAEEQPLDVVVNGVTVHGTWTPTETKT